MKKFLQSVKCAYLLWKMGYYLSDNTSISPDGEIWGFIRLNNNNVGKDEKGEERKYALVDIDFSIKKDGWFYSHLHTLETIWRYDSPKK